MKKLLGAEIRRMWLDFFESKGHYIEPGASLIPHNDPTLLWINSGVAALKKYFDGSVIPPHKRITNAQKSIRTNDIDNVGRTARHHTFFEMLGNFSIGDYFRTEAITWGYELLTSPEYFAIPKEKLYITYHPSDNATKELWISLGIDPSHLVPLEHNFWQIGEGPCGPNTEIFFDRGEAYDPEHLGEKLMFDDIDNDRYIEIWNIVFSQYNAEEGKSREEFKELPHKNIDTGAGLERLACIFQNTETNFETDLFYPYIEEVQRHAKYKYADNKMAYRVIADHIRTCTFALSDGASFSNEGRGYVLRRILRRAVRYLKKLGISKPFLYTLVPLVAENMKDYYPYLKQQQDRVMKMIKSEEEKFASTLSTGEALLLKMATSSVMSGKDAFRLYDTYGFPIELTEEILSEKGISVDIEGFNKEMQEQKERARKARNDAQSMNAQAIDLMEFKKESKFIYDPSDITATVIGIFKDGHKVSSLEDEGEVVFDITNFYATSGGQDHDNGVIINSETEGEVYNVFKAPNHQHLHSVKLKYGSIKEGDIFTLKIDQEKRRKTQKNHSAVHLLQKALQVVLGNDVHQEGSFVSDEYLRFDFNYLEKISADELNLIESYVNNYIAQELPTSIRIMSLQEAKDEGAMALFSEKYGNEVRVVSFGDVSKELCGGTHVENTSCIGCFALISESSIASGIRRIEAKTSYAAYELLKNKEKLLNNAANFLKVQNVNDVNSRLVSIAEETNDLRKKNLDLTNELASLKAKNLINSFEDISGIKVLTQTMKNTSREMFSSLFDSLKTTFDPSIVVLALVENEKTSLIVGVSKSLLDRYDAGKIMKDLARICEGSGGGRKDVAQGGTKKPELLEKAFAELKKGITL